MEIERLKFIAREAINVNVKILDSLWKDDHLSHIKECIGITDEEYNYIFDVDAPPEEEFDEMKFYKCV